MRDLLLKTPDPVDSSVQPSSSSSKKLQQKQPFTSDSRSKWSGFRVVDIDLIFSALSEVLSCKECGKKISINEVSAAGLHSKFQVECVECGEVAKFNGSEMIGPDKKIAESNRRVVYAMQSLGLGQNALQKMSAIMDFPPAVSYKTFTKALNNIHAVTQEICEESMKSAAAEEVQLTGSRDITVSGDGSWQRRGYTSKNGVCTLIGLKTGKVIDTHVMSTFCKGCCTYKGLKSGIAYEEWWATHQSKCSINHNGTSGMMEVTGMKIMFQRSEETYDVRYSRYIGDGDSKTYVNIVKDKPYVDIDPEKLECVGHVQKRMGTRLRKLKAAMKSKKLSDGKALGGRRRLTDKFIDKLSSFYGKAIRENNDVKSMNDAIWAIFYHYRSTDEEPTHHLCPTGENSWCKYQQSIAQGKEDFEHRTSISTAVMDVIRPIFQDLASDSLLKRCVQGCTQNPNESLNNLIWKGAPKTKFCGRAGIETATSDAVLVFNDGQTSRLRTLHAMGISPGKFAIRWADRVDNHRITQAELRAQAATKEARTARRRLRLEVEEKLQAKEGPSYEPGGF